MQEKVLVVGGAGCLGSHIVDILMDKYDVIIFDNLSSGNLANLGRWIGLGEAYRVREKELLHIGEDDVKDMDVIIYCAGQVSTFDSVINPDATFRNNVEGTYRLYEAIRKYNPKTRVLLTSSRSVHGDMFGKGVANEETPYNPSNNYSLSKVYMEMLAKVYRENYRIETTVLRPSNIYGSKMPSKGQYGFLARWIHYVLNNQPIPIWGNGSQVRDYVYVDDVAESYFKCIQNPDATKDETFLLATGEGVSVKGLAIKLLCLCGSEYAYDEDLLKYYPLKQGDIQGFVGDSSKIQKLLKVKFRSLDEGLPLTIEWVKQNMNRYKDDSGDLR